MAVPTISQYGLPVAYDASEYAPELDCRLFALYFLVTETLTTYLGYRITQHCLRGRGLYMVPPFVRTWVVILYCAVKIRVIDYAFHGSLYLIVSSITSFCFTLCTLVAIVFHFGPMQFVFADFRHKRKLAEPSSGFTFGYIMNELKHFLLKQHFHEYANQLMSTRNQHETLGSVCSTLSTTPTVVRVPLLVGSFQLEVPKWNEWLVKHSISSVTKASRTRAPAPALSDVQSESRFIVLMHAASGLLLDINLTKRPSASLMARLHRDAVYPFELVVRVVETDSGRHDIYFLYAESPMLVGVSTAIIKHAIFAMLVQLNAAFGHPVDVLLRSLRCKDFVSAERFHEVAFKRTRPRKPSLSSHLESAFG